MGGGGPKRPDCGRAFLALVWRYLRLDWGGSLSDGGHYGSHGLYIRAGCFFSAHRCFSYRAAICAGGVVIVLLSFKQSAI